MDIMKTVSLYADWAPKPDFKLGSKDIDGKLSYLGSKVWKNPRVEIVEIIHLDRSPTTKKSWKKIVSTLFHANSTKRGPHSPHRTQAFFL